MLEIIKNMWRRKLRTALTIFGITIGVLALVVMGAMSEKLNLLVEGGVKFYQDKVQVTSSSAYGLIPMKMSQRADIQNIEGVAYVSPGIYATLSKETSTVNFGPPASIVAVDAEARKYESFPLTVAQGRKLEDNDSGKVMLGSDLVKKLNAEVGKNVTVRGKQYEVVGIWEKTFTTPDTAVTMTLPDAQEVVYNDLPPLVQASLKPSDIVSGFVAYPKKGVDPNKLSDLIQKEMTGIQTVGPKQFEEQVVNSVKTVSSIIYGVAIISLLIGSLSIINTMTMSISERTKEIGIKKALGAKTRTILAEYLTEAGIIGLFGGLAGAGIGSLIVTSLNATMEKTGDKIFLLTPNLIITSLIFAITLGVIAGILPAVHAARISIVKSLREE